MLKHVGWRHCHPEGKSFRVLISALGSNTLIRGIPREGVNFFLRFIIPSLEHLTDEPILTIWLSIEEPYCPAHGADLLLIP